ncbi:uncharacterized protein SOCE26_105690 [Sorangium cellulosum]|uniref:Uncharacterized protein n=1 Tax=Sorangium cellulosum TaxID=56 RepID=A0A2L0FBT9_SORCE|nr:uncharacterized protein SOCE26_105690 [Sorangium cellulosum]
MPSRRRAVGGTPRRAITAWATPRRGDRRGSRSREGRDPKSGAPAAPLPLRDPRSRSGDPQGVMMWQPVLRFQAKSWLCGLRRQVWSSDNVVTRPRTRPRVAHAGHAASASRCASAVPRASSRKSRAYTRGCAGRTLGAERGSACERLGAQHARSRQVQSSLEAHATRSGGVPASAERRPRCDLRRARNFLVVREDVARSRRATPRGRRAAASRDDGARWLAAPRRRRSATVRERGPRGDGRWRGGRAARAAARAQKFRLAERRKVRPGCAILVAVNWGEMGPSYSQSATL